MEVLPAMHLPDLWLKAMLPASRAELPRVRALLHWLSAQLAGMALGSGFDVEVRPAVAHACDHPVRAATLPVR